MKKIALWTLLSLSSTLIAEDTLLYELEPIVGYNNFDSDSKMQNNLFYGIRGTVYANSYYAYRLSYERADKVKYDTSKYFAQKSTDVQRISGDILMSGEEEYNVVPYVLLGVGYELLSDETSYDVSQGYISTGLGFKYQMPNNLSFNLEGRVFKKFDTKDVDYALNIGLGYMFGYATNTVAYQENFLEQNQVQEREIINATPQQEIYQQTPVVVNKPVTTKYSFEEQQAQNNPILSDVSQPTNTVYSSDESVVDEAYYVQLAAWFEDQNPKLLDRIQQGGFDAQVLDVVRKDKSAQVVVVGPFLDMSEAKQALRGLKRIKRDAYITKLN
jgi:cell division septation protein DedD